MKVKIEKTFEVNLCNDCPFFVEVEDTSVCFDSFDEPNFDWYCTNRNASNEGTSLEQYNNENGVAIGGSYSRFQKCKIPEWCPFKDKNQVNE